MADWSKPTILSNYVVFVDEVKARDVDALTLQKDPITGPPVGAIKLVRSPVKFQEWSGTAFVDLILSPAGGGTGVSNISLLPAAMGLGTMAFQNSNAVNITGGSIVGPTQLGGNMVYGGGTFQFTSNTGTPVGITGPNIAGTYALFIQGGHITGCQGLGIAAGTGSGDSSFIVYNHNLSLTPFQVRGDGVTFAYHRLVIPVGANKWA